MVFCNIFVVLINKEKKVWYFSGKILTGKRDFFSTCFLEALSFDNPFPKGLFHCIHYRFDDIEYDISGYISHRLFCVQEERKCIISLNIYSVDYSVENYDKTFCYLILFLSYELFGRRALMPLQKYLKTLRYR